MIDLKEPHMSHKNDPKPETSDPKPATKPVESENPTKDAPAGRPHNARTDDGR
jgi:hypothetical protein